MSFSQLFKRLQNLDQGTAVALDPIFSVEADPKKLDLILREHNSRHVFQDVNVFRDGEGYCYRCKTCHKIERDLLSVDIFISGPSCKDLSTLNTEKRKHSTCYQLGEENEDTDGTSGPTYKYGFRKALCLGLALFTRVCMHIYIYISMFQAFFKHAPF